jgi:hypothetical protein
MAQTEEERRQAEATAEAERQRRAAEATAAQAAAEREAALDALEAKHAAIHAQALAVVNIKNLIPITLDRITNNYDRWRKVFLITLGKYALTDHVLSDEVHPTRSAWAQMECTVMSWIYNTISPDLQQQVLLKELRARVAWLVLDDEFLGQRESRALLLSAEFRNFRQGALNITDYCRRLETMASSLAEFGDPVGDRTLVMTLIRGLNGTFRHMMSHLKLQRPFPMFNQARNLLLLEEVDLKDAAADDAAPPAAALYASGGGAVSSISSPLRPKGRNGLDTAPWSGAPNQSMVGGPPSHSAIKRGWGPRLAVRGSPRRRYTPPHKP